MTPLPPGRRSAGLRRERDSSASARSASARTCSGSRAHSSYGARASSRSSATVRCGVRSRAGRGSGSPAPSDHGRVAAWIAAADVVCQPSVVEPFGLATLEGLASGRSVVATSVGGPPEFVPAGAGVLVDPTDDDSVRAGLDAAAQLPRPNPAARSAAEAHDVRRQVERVEELLVRAAASRGRRA